MNIVAPELIKRIDETIAKLKVSEDEKPMSTL